MKTKSSTRNRFTEEQKHAALADMAAGMTIEQTSKKYGCSPSALSSWKTQFKDKPSSTAKQVPAPTVQVQEDGRVSSLEQENKNLRRLLLDGYIGREANIKLKKIGIILRDNKAHQREQIMETLLTA